MTTYYLDSSALIKRYVQETGTAWIRSLVASAAEHTILTARVTMVEVFSALARRRREGSVSVDFYVTAVQAFLHHSVTAYDFIELDLRVVTTARELLERQPLRAYDAVQLASALIVDQALQAGRLSPLVFLSADDRLNEIALAEGVMVDNPNA